MLNRIIAFSLKNRMLVLAAAVLMLIYGGYQALHMRVDVLPDLNRPVVTIMTETPGLAPEEVETLVSFPIETVLNGATGVQRVRSASGIGLSVVYVEFEWGTDIYVDRQIVSEKLQLVRERLPAGMNPVMGPISSIMGEIMLLGMWSEDGTTSPMDVRTSADWVVRPRLLSVAGVSQVTVMGGGVKEWQVVTSPERLRQYDVTLEELTKAVGASNVNAGGGFLLAPTKEHLIRITGRVESLEEIANAVVVYRNPAPVLVKHVADVRFGSPVKRGDGSVNASPAVILSVQKQPNADTIKLSAEVDKALLEIKSSLPKDVKIHNQLFRQQEFIDAAIKNVEEALRDGGVLVVVILFLFLWNFRTSIINLTAIPLSLIATALVFSAFGMSINTMTLGGLAVAIGELVDDSIVDVENIFRRLKENRTSPAPQPFLAVIYSASSEVRNSIVYATLIIGVVLVPLLSLGGIEGRLFAPIGISYLVSLFASLVVSLTVTPVLASLLLPKAKIIEHAKDAFLLRWLKAADLPLLKVSLRHPYLIMLGALLMVGVAGHFYLKMGKEFLPAFNEGTFTVNVITNPGTSLEESNRLGVIAEKMIKETPEVETTSRRTGRAELDEHAEGVNYSEIDVRLKKGRPRGIIMDELRDKLAYMAGAMVNVGQPISHRIDHLMSGVRAQVAVKIFGADLGILRNKAQELNDAMSKISGIVDLQVEPQVEIPQLRVRIKTESLARFGLTKLEVAEALETALKGRAVSQILQEQRTFDLVVWYEESARNNPKVIEETLIHTPSGARIPLSEVAEVLKTTGPNTINRENVMRRIVVSCNVAGRDLAGVVGDIQAREKDLALPQGYFVQYGGQFEAQQAAMARIYVLSVFALLGIFMLLVKALGSWRAALQCMVNLPLAFVGGVIAIYLSGDRTLSVASLVGFITLTGIVMRNGIMMISHYVHLMKYEGEKFDEHMIIRGSLERLAPVLMTAICAIIGLVPLAIGKGETGKEILHPLAIVVIGGLISSSLLDQVVTPALFFKFGRKVYEHKFDHREEEGNEHAVPADLMAVAKRMH
jgi:CzcA family heavy metal efflux pump